MKTRQEKEAEVELLREKLSRANSVVLADYRGLTVADSKDLRSRLRAVGEGQVDYRITKNTLLRIAVDGTDVAPVRPMLEGPTAVAFAFEEPMALMKTLVDYAKDNEKFEIKGGFVEGEVVDLAAIRRMAALPGKEELRGMLAGTLQSPLRNLAGTLQALLGNMRHALDQRQQQLEAQS